MPTYDYVCSACGHTFEHFQDMSAKKLRTCPKCRKAALERQVGAGAGLIFKGSGFYITDYKRAGATGGSEAGATGESGSTPTPGTSAKPAGPGGEQAAATTAPAPAAKPSSGSDSSQRASSSGEPSAKASSRPSGKAPKKG